MPILALDIATHCGFALRTSRCVLSGVEDFTERRGETRGGRLWRFQQWIAEFHRADPLSLLAYEKAQGHMRGAAQSCYAQFEGVLLAWAAKREIPVCSVNPKTLKRVIAGSGNANKAAMVEAMRREGFKPADDNEADAIAVLLYATRRRTQHEGTATLERVGGIGVY